MDHGMVLILRELGREHVGNVLARLGRLPGAEVRPRREIALSDALVDAIAESGRLDDIEAAVLNPRLTPDQLCRLITAGGARAVAAAFPQDSEPQDSEPQATEAQDPEPRNHELRDPDPVDPSPAGPEPVSPESPLDASRRALREPGVTAGRVVALLRAHPVLAHTGRRPGPAGVLHTPDAPVSRAEALKQAGPALRAGVLSPSDVRDRMRPAMTAVQTLATAAREHSHGTAGAVVRDTLRETLTAGVGAEPAAWAHVATALPRFTGTLPELLTRARTYTGPAAIAPARATRPAFSFLLRQLDADALTLLVPHLDDDTARALIPGNVVPAAHIVEVAFRSGRYALLEALAEHRYLGRTHAARIKDIGDDRLDLCLVLNDGGVTSELRREIYAGRRADRARAPMGDALRVHLLGTGLHSYEFESMALSGDPAVVDYALPRTKPKALRRIDRIDIVLGLWERADAGVAADILDRHRDRFPDPIGSTAAAALAAGDPTPLHALRARWYRGPKAAPATPEHRIPPAERIRRPFVEGWHWILGAVGDGSLDADDVARHARPAEQALRALVEVDAYRWAPTSSGPSLAELATILGPNVEAWAVFDHLVADFDGTLFELAELAAKVAD